MGNLSYYLPELIVGGTALVVIGLDLLKMGRKYLANLTLFGLALALLAVSSLSGVSASLFNNMLVVDAFGLFFKVIILLVTALIVLMSIDFNLPSYRAEYYAMVCLAALGMMLLVATTELITIFVSLELLAFSMYVLTGIRKDSQLSSEAALKYFLTGAFSSAVLLYGMALVYGTTGETHLDVILKQVAISPALLLGLAFIVAGLGFKVAVAPFHIWAPDVYQGAPTPITAYLSAGSKVAGFAVFLRVMVGGFGSIKPEWASALAIVSVVTMIIGNFAALPQTNIKRLLAYSSIAQAGYILLGLVVASKLGLSAVLFYLIVFAFSDLAAFAVVVVFSNKTGSDEIKDYAGLSQTSPLLSLVLMIALFSLAGIPPLAGFVGKFSVFAAAIEGGYVWLVVIGVLTAAISLFYYINVVKIMYVYPPEIKSPIPVPFSLQAVLIIAVIGILALGVWPAPLSDAANTASKVFFP